MRNEHSHLALRRYSYDALHQLTQVEQFSQDGQLQSTTAYRYDAFGRRLAKAHQHMSQERPQSQYFGWDGDRLVHSEDATLIRHTVYEPGSFVPLLQLQQDKGHKTAAEFLMSEIQDDEDQDSMRFENMPRGQRDLLQGALSLVMQPGGKALQGLPISEETSALLSESVATLQAEHDASAKAHPVTIRHYLTDHLGTPIALVDANGDHAGQVTWAASYNAWGDLKEEYNPHNLYQPIRFQGQQVDPETGLYYNRFRYYDSGNGQYVTQDPIGLNGGIHCYSYVGADPIGWVDPLGLEPGTMAQRGYPQNASVWTDSRSRTTLFYDPNKKEVFQIETSNTIASGAKNDAAQPYEGYITHCQKGLETKEYGTTKIYTTDTARGRWIHGGGSGAERGHNKIEPGKRSLAPRQGWYPTMGFTRGQNEDVEKLCGKIKEFQKNNPGAKVEYSRY